MKTSRCYKTSSAYHFSQKLCTCAHVSNAYKNLRAENCLFCFVPSLQRKNGKPGFLKHVKQDRLTLCHIWSFRKKQKMSRAHFCSTPEKKSSKFQREIRNSDSVRLL